MSAPKVTILDYDVGNLLSVRRAFEHCGADVVQTTRADAVAAAERLVVPGVGAFGDCVGELRARGLVDAIRRFVATGRPLLGICVGMQMLLEEGEEFGRHEGLGFVPGSVCAIPTTAADGTPHKIPHIGWTPLELPESAPADRWRGSILADVTPGAAAYFVHSFTARPADAAYRLADCHYNGRLISAAVQKDNITGTQFHPEKSGPVGLRMIAGFLAM